MYCFSHEHGHGSRTYAFAGDNALAKKFRDVAAKKNPDCLFSGESPRDNQMIYYSLSYFRIGDGSVPVMRYNRFAVASHDCGYRLRRSGND
jgi:hypothetical protein